MGKKIMSTRKLLKRKYIYGPKKDPVWVYLERQMREMEDKGIKPYNNRVGNWLKFLKELRFFFHCEEKRKLKQLWEDVGPPWFFEYSPAQKAILKNLPTFIRQDTIDNHPSRTRAALKEIGITLKFTNFRLLQCMRRADYDDALFFWELFSAQYHQPPSELMPKYTLNAKLLISAIVFIDLKECIQELEKLTRCAAPHSQPKEKETRKYWEPKIKFGSYLQKLYVPVITKEKVIPKKPCPLPMKIRIQNEEFYRARALKDAVISIQERKKRHLNYVAPAKKQCNYKFWQAPIMVVSSSNPVEAARENAYAMKLRMYRSTATAKHLKLLPQYPNEVVAVGSVAFTGGSPVYILNTVSYIPTGYIIESGGQVQFGNEYITYIKGHYLYPRPVQAECQPKCTCIEKWDECIMRHLRDRSCKCKCGHWYDLYNDGKTVEKYIYPPNKYGPVWFDHAKIYHFFYPTRKLDRNYIFNYEDFIRDRVDYEFNFDWEAKSSTARSIAEPKPWEYLRAFFADLSKSPLLIPHLPVAYHLNVLCEWARQRMHGKIGPRQHKQMLLHTERRWAALGHIDFRTRAYHIPFTEKELKRINFTHRSFVGKLARKMFVDFKMRTGLRQVQRTQLWLGSMKHDSYPSKQFTDVFFCYLPARVTDVQILTPYKPPAFMVLGNTCSLRNQADNMI